MKLMLKLMVVAVAIALLLPVIRPDTQVSEVVSAAIKDVGSFCERNPSTCDQGQQIAVRAGDLITHALRTLGEDEPSSQPLTAQDRNLAPAFSANNPQDPATPAPHAAQEKADALPRP